MARKPYAARQQEPSERIDPTEAHLKPEERLFLRWRRSPYHFIKDIIEWKEGEGPTRQQQEGLEMVGKIADAKYKVNNNLKCTEEDKQLAGKLGISIRSGHGTGKDCWLSWVYFWLLTVFPSAIGMVTAPTSHQLDDILWKEFRSWQLKSKFLAEKFEVQSDKVFLNEPGAKGTRFVSARTANVRGTEDEQAEALAGQHDDFMILAADEASALPKGTFRPIEGAMTGKMNFAIMIGNPTRATGYFFESHTKNRNEWVCLHWSSEECERIPQSIIEADIKRFGRDSNWYRVRRLGEFPITDESTLIPYEWALNAVGREIEASASDTRLVGLDVGGGGDDSVMLFREGNIVGDYIPTCSSPDTMKVTGWAMSELADTDYDMGFLDPIGIGAGVNDRLRELGVKKIFAVDVREASSEPAFFRLRDELLWKVREAFENGTISIPNDDELIGELTTIKYDTPDSTGKIKVESKKDMRARGLRSPNKLDALALTYYFRERAYRSLGKMNKFKQKPKPINWRTM